jgi:hypothetical protein
MDDAQVTFPWIYGGAVIWTTPLEGLRLGSTAMQSRYNIQSVLRYDVYIPDDPLNDPPNNDPGHHPFHVDVDETVKIDHIATVSAEYIRDDLTLVAEYHHDGIDTHISRGWYVLAGYRFSRLLSLAGYYADAEHLGGNVEIRNIELNGLPDYYGWQRDLTISSRFDLNDFWLFKLEYHFIDGVALTQPRSLEEDLADPMKRHWGMFAAKTTFHF